MKTLERYIEEVELTQLKQLIGCRIWFIRSSFLSANLNEKTYTASYFQIPFFQKDENGYEQSRNFEFSAEWIEEEETLLDYYTLKIRITEQEKSTDYFEKKELNSNISFADFQIDEIQILSRDEVIDEEIKLKNDEGILLIDKNKNKILLSVELKCADQVEFINDLEAIENRITGLEKRKTFSNKY